MAFRPIKDFKDIKKILEGKKEFKTAYSTTYNVWVRFSSPTHIIVINEKPQPGGAEWQSLLRFSPSHQLGARNFYDLKETSWDKFLVDEENSILLCPDTRIAINY